MTEKKISNSPVLTFEGKNMMLTIYQMIQKN